MREASIVGGASTVASSCNFFGLGYRLHPKVALQFGMRMMPVTWKAKRLCIDFSIENEC